MNTKESIKKVLESKGYLVRFSGGDLVIGKKGKEPIDAIGIGVFDVFCLLLLETANFIIRYEESRITTEKIFTNLEDAIAFIEDRFPI